MDAVELAYDEAGRGPAVVLIHGHPFNRSMWALGLVATTAEPVTETKRSDRRTRAGQVERDGIRALAEDMATHLFGPEADPAVSEPVMTMMLATDPRGAAAALRGRAERPAYRPLLRALDLRPSSPSATRTFTPPRRSPTT